MAKQFNFDKAENAANMASMGASVIAPPTGTKKPQAGKAALAADAAEGAKATKGVVILEDAGKVAAEGGVKILGKTWGAVKKIAGWLVLPLTVLVGAIQTAKAMHKKDGHGAAKAVGGTAGSIVGMMVTDSLVGMIFGPVGGFVGLVVGLVVGVGAMVGGGWLGSKAVDGAVGDAWHRTLNSSQMLARSRIQARPVASAPPSVPVTAPAVSTPQVAPVAVAAAESSNTTTISYQDRINAERAKQAQAMLQPQQR